MSIETQANNLINKYNGLISVRRTIADGMTTYVALSRMANAGFLEKVGPGIYMHPNEFGDGFVIAQLRLSKGIFFKETALYLRDHLFLFVHHDDRVMIDHTHESDIFIKNKKGVRIPLVTGK